MTPPPGTRALCVVVLLLVAACGDPVEDDLGGVADLATPAESAAVGGEDAQPDAAAFEECLADAGIDVAALDADVAEVGEDDGTAPLDDLDPSTLEAALDECGDLLPSGAFDLSPQEEREIADLQLRWTRCMQEEGIDLPDPGTTGGNAGQLPDADPASLEAAAEACNPILEEASQALGDESGGGGGG